MDNLERYGVGEIVFSGRKEVVLVRTYGGALQMVMLNYASEIEKPPVAKSSRLAAGDKSVGLAEELIQSWTDKHFDFSHYVDRYQEDLRKLIDAKVHGREIVVTKEEKEPVVFNLMDALRKSMTQAQKPHGASEKSSNGRRHPPAERKRRSRSRRRAS